MSEQPTAPEAPQQGIIAEFFSFLRHNWIWWLTPIVLVLLAMIALILSSEGEGLMPFVYTVI